MQTSTRLTSFIVTWYMTLYFRCQSACITCIVRLSTAPFPAWTFIPALRSLSFLFVIMIIIAFSSLNSLTAHSVKNKGSKRQYTVFSPQSGLCEKSITIENSTKEAVSFYLQLPMKLPNELFTLIIWPLSNTTFIVDACLTENLFPSNSLKEAEVTRLQ